MIKNALLLLTAFFPIAMNANIQHILLSSCCGLSNTQPVVVDVYLKYDDTKLDSFQIDMIRLISSHVLNNSKMVPLAKRFLLDYTGLESSRIFNKSSDHLLNAFVEVNPFERSFLGKIYFNIDKIFFANYTSEYQVADILVATSFAISSFNKNIVYHTAKSERKKELLQNIREIITHTFTQTDFLRQLKVIDPKINLIHFEMAVGQKLILLQNTDK